MINIALKETKNNIFFIVFAVLGLSILFAIIFVLLNFRLQVSDSYWARYDNKGYVSLESDSNEILNFSNDNLFVYTRAKGLTYDTVISYQNNEIDLPSYLGGICVVSTKENIVFFPNMLRGEEFSLNERYIWLSEALATLLGCDIGSELKLGNNVYYVKGIFDHNKPPTVYENMASFFVFCDNVTLEKGDTFTALVFEPDELMKIAKIDNGKIFKDNDGVLELCRGFNTLCIGTVFVICFLMLLLIIFFVSIIRVYLLKREDYIRILYRIGIGDFKLILTYILVFAIVTFCACSLAMLWNVIFNTFIFNWADIILNITINSPNYFLQWILGIVSSFALICIILPLILKRRLYKREVSNQ